MTCKSQHRFRLLMPLLCIIIVCSVIFSGCSGSGNTASTASQSTDSQNADPVSKTGEYFDTVITLTLYGKDKESYLDHCFKMAKHYEDLLSNTVKGSDISRINAANGKYVTVDDDTVDLLKKGIHYCKLSNGKFDITIGKVSDLWHFTDNDGDIPSKAKIKKAVAGVNYKNISIRGNKVALKSKNAKLDLGAIAKGYIADQMKDYLKKEGITSGMINLGGNVVVIGNKPDGTPYNVGIQKPFDEQNAAIAAIKVSDKSIVSSGVYERYFRKNNRLYHHILNTSTGYPVSNHLYGVTIISDKSVDGDGLSTTCFVLGLKDGMKLINSLKNTEAVFITDDYKMHYSNGIGKTIPITKE